MTFAAGDTGHVAEHNRLLTVGGAKFNVVDASAGDVATSIGATWAAINSTTWDVTIAAVAGDVIGAGFSGRFIGAAADHLHVDMFTVISGALTNSWATNAAKNDAHAGMLFVPTNATGVTATRRRACASGDLESGSIKFRISWRSNGSTATQTACASTASGVLQVWVANYGQ